MQSFIQACETRLGWRLDLATWLTAQVLGDAHPL
jgi:hypothetical protein